MTKMQKYELLYIIPNTFTKDETKKINEKVEKIIIEKGGNVIKTDAWGKKRLAYQINHFNYGYYYLINFEDKKNIKVAEINHLLRLSTEIIRFLIIKKNKKLIKEKSVRKNVSEFKKHTNKEDVKKITPINHQDITKKTPDKKKKENINMKDLDKKLDNILSADDLL